MLAVISRAPNQLQPVFDAIVQTARRLCKADHAVLQRITEAGAIAAASDEGASLDRAAVEQALERAQGVIARAARELGLSRQALYRRMEKLGLRGP